MAKRKLLNLEKFEVKKINRSTIKTAPYNPRKIDEDNKKKLARYIKKQGLLMPSFVLNKTNGNLVSGHQRLQIMDTIHQRNDYEITVSIVKLTPKQEVEANVKLNSQNLMGEWDPEKIIEMSEQYEVDLIKDLDFKEEQLDILFAEIDRYVDQEFQEDTEVYTEYQEANNAKLKAAKEKYKERIAKENKDGTTIYSKDDDYTLTIIFPTNTDKWDCMKSLNMPKAEKYINSEAIKPLQPIKTARKKRVKK